MDGIFAQRDHAIRFDWGLTGAVATAADVCVVVDVLSFSTSVTVAVERGMRVLPFAWNDERAASYAAAHDAVLAVGRLEATRNGAVPAPSLSPAGLLECDAVPRLVLPSPNGSTIAAALQDAGATVVVGCLRNAEATARWLSPAVAAGGSVAVVAAGERWEHDGSLRPALEDHLGSGAILAALARLGHRGIMSPEARAAGELFEAGVEHLFERLTTCVGGRELAAKGFGADVEVAAALTTSTTVPVLHPDGFR